MTWGLNLGDGNITNEVEMARTIFEVFSPESEATENGVTLDFIELGTFSESFVPTILTRWLHGRKRARSLPWSGPAIELDSDRVC